MCKWIHIVALFLLPFLSVSQSPSSKGRFSVAFNRGCAPLTVNISSLDDFGDVTRLYSYNDPDIYTNDTTFTYDSIGIYEIIQVIGKDSIGDKTDTLVLEVLEPQKPEILVTRCNGLQFSITSVDNYYDSVRVYFNSFDSVTLQANESYNYTFQSAGIQTIGLEGLFDNASEVCPNYFEEVVPIENILTPELLSASVKETCRGIYSLYLQLDQVQEAINYRVIFTQSGNSVLYDGFLDSTFLFLNEVPFTLEDYCVSVEVVDPCNGSVMKSNDICTIPTELSLSPFETLYSSYEESSIYINLDEVASGTFEIERKFEGGIFEARSSREGSFHDPIGSIARKYSYRINYRDECGEVLFSAETNPPFVDAEEIDDNRYEIFFSSAINTIEGASSELYHIGDENPITQTLESNPLRINLDPNNGVSKQFLSASTDYGDGLVLNSNTITLKYELIVHVPTAFTPNGDGLNDTLDFYGVPSENASVKIYSKWGQTIYSSNDLNVGWDGRISGKKAEAGTYLYEIVLETSSGDKLRQRGTFVLLEN